MSGLRVYVDHLSQPSRAVLLFLRANDIRHEVKPVSIRNRENRSEEYMKEVHPFGKVPAMIDGNFKLFESVAILRYLARKYDVPDHWYPKSLEGQARVDEFIEWHHIGLRIPLVSYFHAKVVRPLLMGVTAEEKELQMLKGKMETAMDDFERIWMENGTFVVGNSITLGDLLALCEIDELAAAGYDPSAGRPKTTEWLERVRSQLGDNYQEIIAPFNQFAQITANK